MDDLLAGLEAVDHGSRELDCQIYGELNPEYKDWTYSGRDHPNEYWRSPNGHREVCYIPLYTTSLDAGKSLIPDDCHTEIRLGSPVDWMEDRASRATVAGPASGDGEYATPIFHTGSPSDTTPELALCIAALKAIKEMALRDAIQEGLDSGRSERKLNV